MITYLHNDTQVTIYQGFYERLQRVFENSKTFSIPGLAHSPTLSFIYVDCLKTEKKTKCDIFDIIYIDNKNKISDFIFTVFILLSLAELHLALMLQVLVHHLLALDVTLQGAVEGLSHLH